jgi:hypothetical protein
MSIPNLLSIFGNSASDFLNANLTDSPSISYTNNSVVSGYDMWAWNSGKGLLVTSDPIFTAASGSKSLSVTPTTTGQSNQVDYVIPDGLAWVYAVVIGGGGGGSSRYPPRPGGGGGGCAFAKIDLRGRQGQIMRLKSGECGPLGGSGTISDRNSFIEFRNGGANTTLITANGGTGGAQTSYTGSYYPGGPGGTTVVNTSSTNQAGTEVIYTHSDTGGLGGGTSSSTQDGHIGGTGGGGTGSGQSGGVGRFIFGSGGAGGNNHGGGGDHTVNYTLSNYYDSARSLHPMSKAKEYSMVSGMTFFNDANINNAFTGRNESQSTTNTVAGFFGGGGGGSGGGSGCPGGPGAIILWWD